MIKILISILLVAGFASRVGAQQNVGIGTNSPQSKLHVKGTGGGTQIILEENAGSILRISNEANAAGPYIGTSSNHGFSIVSNNEVRMVFATNGNVGIGLDNPQQRLGIRGGIVVDQDNQNTGTSANILRFGGNSGEGIGSKRSAGANQFGLDFYTDNTLRMTVGNNGNIGVGTNNPQGLLEIKAGNNRSIIFKDDLVPTMELVSSAANDPLAGIMRFRNSIELMPNSAGTRAGKLDVRNAAGNATITLDGATGNVLARNLAAIAEKNSKVRIVLNEGASSLLDVVLCEILVDIPGPGSVHIEGGIYGFLNRLSVNAQNPPNMNMHMKLDGYSASNAYITTVKKYDFEHRDYSDPVVSCIQTVSGPATKRFKLILYRNGDGVGRTVIEDHFIRVTYYPGSLNYN